MSNGGSGRKKASRPKVEKSDDFEVDQLLQSAQDELLLKLSVDSHMSRVSPDYILPDLDRRFQALKSRPTAGSKSATVPKSSQQQQQKPQPLPDAIPTHDLLARFAALKASSSSSGNSNDNRDNAAVGPAVFEQQDDDEDEDDEEDEVEKIIRWAKDAARLDPSLPSDDDVDDDSAHYESDQDLENVNKMDGPVKGKRK